MPAEPRGAQVEPVDLAMWHRVLALSDNTMQPVIRHDLAALVSLASSLAAEVERLEAALEQTREFIRRQEHMENCAVWESSAPTFEDADDQCSCGRTAALGTKGAE